LIGLVTSVRLRPGQTHGPGFTITSDTIRAMLVDRRSSWSGIGGYWVCGSTAKWLNVPQPAGILVQRVARGSPAFRLGLRGGIAPASIGDERFVIGGDIVLSVQGVALTGPNDYAQMQAVLAGLDSSATLRMTVLREGRQIGLQAPIHR
jgi:serine protease Do